LFDGDIRESFLTKAVKGGKTAHREWRLEVSWTKWLSSDHGPLVIGTIFIVFSAGAYVVKEFAWPLLRHFLLQHPVRARVIITSDDRYNVGYAIQNEFEHETKELVLPPHKDGLMLHFILTTRLSFTQTHLELSFEEDRNSKPLIEYYFSPFIKVGKQEKKPGETETHYLDYHDNYHIDEIRERLWGQTIAYGFKITTRNPGRYTMKIGVGADGVDASTTLIVRFEAKPTGNMLCKKHANCIVRPNPAAW
jgi:hypothetical protein